jgi:DNA-binding transcriptional LysR family regulator
VIPLVEERLVVALSDSHPLAQLQVVPVHALADAPFVSFPRRIGAGLYDNIVAVCAAAGFSPKVVQEANEMQTIVSLVSAGIGVALVPESMQNFTLPHLAMRPLSGSSAILRLALAHRADSTSPLVRQFVEAAVAAAREPVYL